MSEPVISKGAGEHGFTDGSAADADTGIMTAFGDDAGFIAVFINGFAWSEDGACGLKSDTHDDCLSAGNAT